MHLYHTIFIERNIFFQVLDIALNKLSMLSKMYEWKKEKHIRELEFNLNFLWSTHFVHMLNVSILMKAKKKKVKKSTHKKRMKLKYIAQ